MAPTISAQTGDWRWYIREESSNKSARRFLLVFSPKICLEKKNGLAP
jgi:hypothetical protein